jgi:hypothetical protein
MFLRRCTLELCYGQTFGRERRKVAFPEKAAQHQALRGFLAMPRPEWQL